MLAGASLLAGLTKPNRSKGRNVTKSYQIEEKTSSTKTSGAGSSSPVVYLGKFQQTGTLAKYAMIDGGR